MHQMHPQIFNPTNILITDGEYGSILSQKLVTNKNIRNMLVL